MTTGPSAAPGSTMPTRDAARAGAALALENANSPLRCGQKLETLGVFSGPSIALYVASIEEAAKATGWWFYSMGASDDQLGSSAKRAMRSLQRGHKSRLLVASLTEVLTQPLVILGIVGLLGIAALLGQKPEIDTETMLRVLEKPPEGALGRFSELWDLRQRGLYVDWRESAWELPRDLTADEAAEVGLMAAEHIDMVGRLLRGSDARSAGKEIL